MAGIEGNQELTHPRPVSEGRENSQGVKLSMWRQIVDDEANTVREDRSNGSWSGQGGFDSARSSSEASLATSADYSPSKHGGMSQEMVSGKASAFSTTGAATMLPSGTQPYQIGEWSEPMESSYTELLVVRHGETTWNHNGRLQGQAESDLNDTGRRQANFVAAKLAKVSSSLASVVYTSDLRRSSDTADIIAEACGSFQVEKVAGLRERHLGQLQGCTIAEAKEKFPKAYFVFISKQSSFAIPGGGESQVQFDERVITTVKAISAKHIGQRVIIVCHGGVIRTLHWLATGRPPHGKIRNASISILRMGNGRLFLCAARFNEVAHLKSPGGSAPEDAGFGGDALSA